MALGKTGTDISRGVRLVFADFICMKHKQQTDLHVAKDIHILHLKAWVAVSVCPIKVCLYIITNTFLLFAAEF